MLKKMINDAEAPERRPLAAKNTTVILTDGKITPESCFALHAKSFCEPLCIPALITRII